MCIENNLPLSISNAKERLGLIIDSSKTEESDLIADLYQEYKALVNALKERSLRRDPELLMRLSLVMRDLGISQISPP